MTAAAPPNPAAPASAEASGSDVAGVDLNVLVKLALRTRPDAVMLREPARRATWSGETERTWSAAQIDRQAERLRAIIALARLPASARVLLLAPMGAELVISLLAVLRAGLSLVLPPLNATQDELQTDLDQAGPVIGLAVSRFGDLEPARLLRDACARSLNARLVAAFGPDAPDGVAALDAVLASEAALGDPQGATPGIRSQIHVRDAAGNMAVLDEARIVAAASELARDLQLGSPCRVVSLMMGADLAALASGPYLAAIARAEFLPLGHFQLSALWAALADAVPTCLVAPAAIEPALIEAGIVGHQGVNEIVYIHRDRAPSASRAHGDGTVRMVIDMLRTETGDVVIAPRR